MQRETHEALQRGAGLPTRDDVQAIAVLLVVLVVVAADAAAAAADVAAVLAVGSGAFE